MKKAILLLLTLALTLGSLPLSAVALTATPLEIPAEVETWERDGVTYTVLRAPEDFSKIVDGGNYILAADVDFGGKETDYLISLSGTVLLEGNCHSITGYTLKGEGDVATFNVKTGAGLTIRNLTLGSASAPISVSTTGGGKSLGTVFGYANCTFTAENLTVYTNVSATDCYAGGMFGNIQGNATVRDCRVYGTLKNGTGRGARGGIFGQISTGLTATVIDCYSYLNFTESGYNTGGIAGRIVSGKPVLLKGCANFGTVRASQYGGGIVGQIQPKNVAVDYTFEDCHNYGSVLGGNQSGGLFGDVGVDTAVTGGEMKIIDCANHGAVSGSDDMSGIAGRINSKYPVTVMNCANFGSVTGVKNTAGLCSSVALSDQKLTVDGFLNTGEITAGTRAGAGVTGWLHSSSVFEFKNCVNLGSVSGTLASNLLAMITANVTLTDSYACSTALNSTAGTGGYVIANPNPVTCTSSGVKYLAAENVEWNTACADSAMTLTEAVEALNAAYTDVFGGFLPNSGNDGIVLAAPKLAGAVEAPNGTSGYSGAIAGAEGAVTYTNNYSVATSLNLFGHNDGGNLKYKTGNVKIDANTDLAAAVAVLNTGLETPAYRLNDGQIEALYSLNSAPVTNYGVQETKAENGAFAVRFIGLLNSKSFTEAGFTVSATIKQEGKADVVVTDKDCKVTSAFDSLLAGNEDITIGTETVKSPLGTDFFAYTITGVPANATVTFTFTPYATASTTVTGATYTVTYVNGVLA